MRTCETFTGYGFEVARPQKWGLVKPLLGKDLVFEQMQLKEPMFPRVIDISSLKTSLIEHLPKSEKGP